MGGAWVAQNGSELLAVGDPDDQNGLGQATPLAGAASMTSVMDSMMSISS